MSNAEVSLSSRRRWRTGHEFHQTPIPVHGVMMGEMAMRVLAIGGQHVGADADPSPPERKAAVKRGARDPCRR
jgi:hypothetical protein